MEMITPEQNFEDYKEKCVEYLSFLQDEFLKLYDIDSYEKWFYDHDIGAFNFKSDDGRNLYFKYVAVGSFSSENSTWNWSWANKSTPLYVSKQLEKVKTFGQFKCFGKLTQGLFDGDEYTGWEMTAISAKLLNTIGAYRVPQEQFFIYFMFTSELTQEEYVELKNKPVKCDIHGPGNAGFICQHLSKDKYTGFHEAFDPDTITDEDDGYEAWCDECEKVRLKEGGWNDRSMAFAKIRLVCDQCYFGIKKRNQTEK